MKKKKEHIMTLFPGNSIIKQTLEEKKLSEIKKRIRDIKVENFKGPQKYTAEALEVSLDYLVDSTDILLKKSIVNKVPDILKKLKESYKRHVFALLDAFIKQTKLQSIM